MNAVFRANNRRALGRAVLSEDARSRLAAGAGLFAVMMFLGLEAAGLEAALRASRVALRELPEIRGEYLVEHLLAGAFGGALVLGFLGSLTTAISALFLSEELGALATLPIPHRRLVLRQAVLTLGLSSAPTLLLATPAILVASASAPRPALAFLASVLPLLGIVLLAGAGGIAGALFFVRAVPPRRARVLAAFLSATGLAIALLGFRAARPERLLDPVEALSVVTRIGTEAPVAPRFSISAWAARGATRGLAGEVEGLKPGVALVAAGFTAFLAIPLALWPLHRHVFQESGVTSPRAMGVSRSRPARSLNMILVRAEAASLLRDASTPAQMGSLAAVFLLDLLNVRLLPSTDASARDLVAGLQTGLALFLVSALSLRFAYPSVSSDGRAALVLRTLPLDPRRHLVARWAVRAFPAAFIALVLTGASLLVLRPGWAASAAALGAALAGGLAIPALHVGLGGVFPRYGAPNVVAIALSAGGVFALVFSTALALLSTLAVSQELRLLAGSLLKAPIPEWLPLAALLAGATFSALTALGLAARSLTTRDISIA